jgi:hypothetical protein
MFYDSRNDLKWLKSLGIDFKEEFPASGLIDIQKDRIPMSVAEGLEEAIGKDFPRLGARRLYEALGFQIDNAHNGGNDAMYELRAFLAGKVLTSTQLDTIAYGVDTLLPILDRFGRPVP